MAGNLLKENIPVEHAIGQGRAQTSAETSVMLSGGDRNVTIVCARAIPTISTTEVQTGGVAVQGTVDFTALYLTDTGELRARQAQTGFTDVIQISDAAPKMRAEVLCTLSGVEATERDGRLDFAADMRLDGFVSQQATESLATAVQASVRMAEKNQVVSALNQTVSAQEREMFAENFVLANEAFTRVVFFAAQPEIDTVQPLEGMVEVTGTVTVESLLTGEDAQAPVGWQVETIPFSVDIENPAFSSDMQVSARAKVRELTSEVVFNQDGEEIEGNLHIEYILEVTAEGYAYEEMSVLSDVYPLSEEPFSAAQAVFSYIETVDRATQTQTLSTDIELTSETTPMGEMIGAFAAPVAMDIIGEKAARAEGLMRVTLLYSTADEIPLHLYTQEVPFALDFNEVSGLSEVMSVAIGKVSAEKMSSTQAQVRIPVVMTGEKIGTAQATVLSDINQEGDPVTLPVGAVLYYPQESETLWDVARRYRVAEEDLKRYNPEGKSPIMVYRRLTEF